MTYAIHPFDYLKALELCATRYSAEMPQQESKITFWDGVGFKLNNHLFTVEISDIAEIIPVPKITPLPGVKRWAKGIANIHGRLIPIVDLRTFFDLPEKISKVQSNRIIVIDQKEISVGLIVDEVQGRQHLPKSDHQSSLPQDMPANIQPFTNGYYLQNDRHIVFDLNRLITNEHFLAAAGE